MGRSPVLKLTKRHDLLTGRLFFCCASCVLYSKQKSTAHQLTNHRPCPIGPRTTFHPTASIHHLASAPSSSRSVVVVVMSTRSNQPPSVGASSSGTNSSGGTHHRTRSRMDEVLQAAATSQHSSHSLNSSPQRGKKRKVE